jgi:hypothetical protein
MAPCVQGGQLVVRLENLLYTFQSEPADFEGWGCFRPLDARRAEFVEEASLVQIDRYLRLFPQIPLRLAYQLRGRTWLAYPANKSDALQRFGSACPVAVCLVEQGRMFDQVVARFDGAAFWYEELDRRDDPVMADALREALRAERSASDLRMRNLTPEARTTYELVASRTRAERERRRQMRDTSRLQDALAHAGGRLNDFHDRGDFWSVEWHTADGELHTSAISKSDLTVVGAGICLSGRDRDFDLQSLVRVIDQRPDWMRE